MTAERLSLRGNLILVSLTRPSDRSAGGIWLPDVRETRATEGKVLATGPGVRLPNGKIAPVWVIESEIVLFPEHVLQHTAPNEGILKETDLLATLGPDDQLYPEGEWVLIDPDVAPSRSRLGIHLADKARRAPHSGTILELGPGELRLKGEMAGYRFPCRSVMNLSPEEEIIGRKVYWDSEATECHAAGHVLVRARDLLAIEGAPAQRAD